MPRTKWTCFLFSVCVIAAACATNPVTGKKQISVLSEAEELAIGQQQDAEIRREMGVYNDSALQRYVSDVGQRLAATSHRPNLPWTFTVVDSPAINAFALPGGYVYITRGILVYLDDESELAGVLGHEIGHVTARHAAQAYTRQAEANLGLTILSIFVPSTAPFSDLSASGLSVLFLKNSRNNELEADRLGVEYGSNAGWDPEGVPRFLATLQRVDSLSERGVPNWLSTHPAPESRVERATPVASKFAGTATARNRDAFLERLNGLIVGDNPKDGIVRGNVFLHPMLRIGLDFPDGWEVVNTAEQVIAREPGTTHYMLLQEVEQPRLVRPGSAGQGGSALGEIAVASMIKAGYKVVDGQMERVNGLDAYVGTYRGDVKGMGKVVMRAAHITVGRQVYVVAGLAPEGDFAAVDREMMPAVRSFRELSRDEASRIHPNHLDFYVVRPGDSWQSIAARQGKSIVNAATLAIMNDHEVSVQPQAGDRVKIVVEG
ncbi:MAG: M48 family metalloprotease [Vicinamibacterales bacterium]